MQNKFFRLLKKNNCQSHTFTMISSYFFHSHLVFHPKYFMIRVNTSWSGWRESSISVNFVYHCHHLTNRKTFTNNTWKTERWTGRCLGNCTSKFNQKKVAGSRRKNRTRVCLEVLWNQDVAVGTLGPDERKKAQKWYKDMKIVSAIILNLRKTKQHQSSALVLHPFFPPKIYNPLFLNKNSTRSKYNSWNIIYERNGLKKTVWKNVLQVSPIPISSNQNRLHYSLNCIFTEFIMIRLTTMTILVTKMTSKM